ncbi:MAG: class I SAM-dependent methyltransferase [Candidatus Humimicrobiaceae bacterium]
MEHKFDPKNKKKLFSDFRKKILPAIKTLRAAGLKEGMVLADIGSGNGYFTFPAADIVGSKGKVFALDILPELLDDISKRIKTEKRNNIEVIKTDENNLKIAKESVSLAFSCNVLHETKDLDLFLKEVKRVLKPSGRITIIDWEKVDSDFGPPKEHRLDKSVIINGLKDIGFKYVKAKILNKDLYRITALKNKG